MKSWLQLLVVLLPACSLAQTLPQIQTVFVIVLENHNWSSIKGSRDAPFMNNVLLPLSSYCAQYYNPPGLHPSLPNYLWLEAGTNFGIRNDNDPSSNHQRTTNHLAAQLRKAGISWKSYQEDISGLYVPLTSTNHYAPKHNPFVYFDDSTGTNNTKDPYGIAHNRPYPELAGDLTNHTVARYNFITPNLCDDTHDSCGPLNNPVRQGDNWLAAEVPKILASDAYKNNGALFITWDEGGNGSDGPIGLVVLSPLAKGGGYFNSVHYTHSSLLRTVQEIFGVGPLLADAARATNLSNLFTSVPVARCRDVTVSAGTNCLADASVDDGSFDPDNDAITLTQSPPGPYPPGTNLVTLTITDSHGAASSCQASVVVQDVTAPVIQCPASMYVTNRHDAWDSIVSFSPFVFDNCPEGSSVICSPASGSVFALGSHRVTCIASDAAGNSSQCQFDITVFPGNQPPVPVIQTTPPLANFPGSTDKVIITSGQFASVLLDGSGSHDPDDAHFSFAWSENGIQLSSNEVTSVNLSLGDHKITLSLDDGFPLGTNSTSIEFEVISPAVAVARLSSLLQDSHGPDQVKQPLQASLSAAAASFDRDHENAGINQLGAFQSKLSARPRQLDSDLRENLMQGAQLIIDELRAEEN